MAQPAAVSRHKVGNRSNNWRGICRRFLCTLQKIGLGNFTERGHKTRTAAESSTVARFASASSSPARGATYSRNALKPKDSKGFHSPEIHREIHCGVEAAPKDKAEPDKDKRRSFTLDEAAAISARLVSHAKTDLQHIWRILKGTGCRLAEVSGLRVADVHLEHAIPHSPWSWQSAQSNRGRLRVQDALSTPRARRRWTARRAADERHSQTL